jgi:hypothetical protein
LLKIEVTSDEWQVTRKGKTKGGQGEILRCFKIDSQGLGMRIKMAAKWAMRDGAKARIADCKFHPRDILPRFGYRQ